MEHTEEGITTKYTKYTKVKEGMHRQSETARISPRLFVTSEALRFPSAGFCAEPKKLLHG